MKTNTLNLPQNNSFLSPFQMCRLFLSHLGFLYNEQNFHLVDVSAESQVKFLKALKELDQIPKFNFFFI